LAKALRHNTELDFYCGTARTTARVRLLNDEALEPGATGWVQFRLADPLAIARGDRYIVRSASPSATVGGGVIVQPQPGRRYRRFRAEVVARLEALARGTPEELLYQALSGGRIAESSELAKAGGVPSAEATDALAALAEEGRVVLLTTQVGAPRALLGRAVPVMARPEWERLLERMGATLAAYHERFPLRLGMPREELRGRVHVEGKYLGAVLECAAAQGLLTSAGAAVALTGFAPRLAPQAERAVSRIMADFSASPYAPPTEAQVLEAVGGEVLQLLLDQGRLLRLAEGVLLAADAYRQMEAGVRAYLEAHESVTVAQVRDLFGTSRKYAVALLEDLDRRHVTRRVGDARVRW
jgi:selenocysteine-specific elongation factor